MLEKTFLGNLSVERSYKIYHIYMTAARKKITLFQIPPPGVIILIHSVVLEFKGVGVDISASSIILFDTSFCREFSAKFFYSKVFFGFEIFSNIIGFSRVEIKGKIKEDLK